MFRKIILLSIFLFCGFAYSRYNSINIDFRKNQKTSIFDSDFGLVKTTIVKKDSVYEFVNQSDKFYYRQILMEKNDSIYVLETEQNIKIFLFFKKHSIIRYNKPLLRYPRNIKVNTEWSWDGIEYPVNKKDSSESHVHCYSLGYDTVKTDLGKLESLVVITEVQNSSGSKNVVKEWIHKDLGLIKSEITINGGGLMGLLRNLLGFGEIVFTLKEVKS